jgi:hypothetical protein
MRKASEMYILEEMENKIYTVCVMSAGQFCVS